MGRSDEIIEGKKIILLTIPAAKSVPTSYARERYIRIGTSKENLRREKLLIYYGAKGLKLSQDTFKKTYRVD